MFHQQKSFIVCVTCITSTAKLVIRVFGNDMLPFCSLPLPSWHSLLFDDAQSLIAKDAWEIERCVPFAERNSEDEERVRWRLK